MDHARTLYWPTPRNCHLWTRRAHRRAVRMLLLLLTHLLELSLLTNDNIAIGLHHHLLSRLLHSLDHVRVILLVLLCGVR